MSSDCPLEEATPLPLEDRLWLVANALRRVEDSIQLVLPKLYKDDEDGAAKGAARMRRHNYSRCIDQWVYNPGDKEKIIEALHLR